MHILLVTGLSGAGKSTALKTLEDLGWEAIDNFPVWLLGRLLETPPAEGRDRSENPLAIGFDSRTRGFDPVAIIDRIKKLQLRPNTVVSTLFLDCAGTELERRYNETRRPHPSALDRPAASGIAQERERMAPLRRWADHVLDTTQFAANELQAAIRAQFDMRRSKSATITVSSFGFSKGMPPLADLVFDMRFLRNPHWVDHLRPRTGQDADVADYVRADPAFKGAFDRITDLLGFLLPRYEAEGKAYINIAFGCTGGRHRSVFMAEAVSKYLRDAGFSPTVSHRNLASRPADDVENVTGKPEAQSSGA